MILASFCFFLPNSKIPTKNSLTQDLVSCWFLCEFVGFDPWTCCSPSGSTTSLRCFSPFPQKISCFFPDFGSPLPDLSIQTTSDVRRITDVRQKRTSDVRNTTDVRKFAEDLSPPRSKAGHPTLAVPLENPSSVCDSHFGPTEPSLSSIAGSRYLCTLVLTKAKLCANSSVRNSASSKVVKSEIAFQKKRRAKDISKLLSKRERNKCHLPQKHVSSSSPLY